MLLDIRRSLQSLRSLVTQWTTYISLDNLILSDIASFEIGNVKIVPSGVCISDLTATLAKLNVNEDHKAYYDQCLPEFYREPGSVAIMMIEAEQSYVRDVSTRVLTEVINILRGFTHLFHPRGDQGLFSIRGWLTRGIESFVCINHEGPRWHSSSTHIGATSPYKISPNEITLLRNHCALDIFDGILKNNARTDFENALMTATHWHGEAINISSPAQEFVWHTVALERLLICNGEESTTDKFSKRLAWLLGNTGQSRSTLCRLARQLYDIRSEIVHAGRTDVSLESLKMIDNMASQAIIGMAHKTQEWKTLQEFRDWIEAQLMGA